MKKIVAILSIIFIVILLSSCKTLVYQDREIQYSNHHTLNLSIDADGYAAEYWQEISKKFESENPNVKINLNLRSDMHNSIASQIESENPPDFIYLPFSDSSDVLESLIQNNALLDISDVFIPELKEKMLSGFLGIQPNESEETIYTAPFSYATKGLWYNKNKFKQNNWEIPITWDDFFKLGDIAKETNQALFTYQENFPEYLNCFIIPSLASTIGANKMYDMLNYVDDIWLSDELLPVINFIYKIGKDSYLLESTKGNNHIQTQSEFLLGKSLFITGGPWMQDEMKDKQTEPNFQWGFTAPPIRNEEDERYVFTDINQMCIPSNARNSLLAKKFLAYQYSDDAILLRAKLTKTVPPIKGAVIQLKPFVSQAYYQSQFIFEQGCKPYVGDFKDIKNTFTMAKYQAYYLISNLVKGDLSPKKFVRDINELYYEFTVAPNEYQGNK